MKCDEFRQQDWAIRYLNGELAEADRDTFEQHFLGCEKCSVDVESLLLTRNELSRQSTQIHAEPLRKPAQRWLWFAIPAGAAAAALIVLLMQPQSMVKPTVTAQLPTPVFVDTNPESQLLALARFDPPAYQEALLRGGTGTPTFRAAMAAYQKKDFNTALTLLKSERRQPRVDFYRAACELLTNDAPGAIATSSRVIAAGETPYLEEAYFLRAKAHLAAKDKTPAIADLRKLEALRGDWQARARQLLTEIEAAR